MSNFNLEKIVSLSKFCSFEKEYKNIEKLSEGELKIILN
jgi:hypothetical protein